MRLFFCLKKRERPIIVNAWNTLRGFAVLEHITGDFRHAICQFLLRFLLLEDVNECIRCGSSHWD